MEFLLIASAHFLALLSPGPDFFLLMQAALRLPASTLLLKVRTLLLSPVMNCRPPLQNLNLAAMGPLSVLP